MKVCQFTPGGLNLDSGHAVPHKKTQEDYDDLNSPPKYLPMIPREKVVEKKYIPQPKISIGVLAARKNTI